MSNANPMTTAHRLALYLKNRDPYMCRDSDLTPAQRRRAWHKAHRSGERGGPGKGEELYGRKGQPTPRRAGARAAMLERRRG